MTNNPNIHPASSLNPKVQVNNLSPASPVPGWLEQVALDDLAESIETWTTHMSNSQSAARRLYGTTGD